jgi:hypothetical protein
MSDITSLKFKILHYIDFHEGGVLEEDLKLKPKRDSYVCIKNGVEKDVIFEGKANDSQVLIPNAKAKVVTIATLGKEDHYYKHDEVNIGSITLMDIFKWPKLSSNAKLSSEDLLSFTLDKSGTTVIACDVNTISPSVFAIQRER